MTREHPYKSLEGLEVWSVLTRAIEDLEENEDLEKTTASPYIVGYLSKCLIEAGVVSAPSEGPSHPTKEPRRKAQ